VYEEYRTFQHTNDFNIPDKEVVPSNPPDPAPASNTDETSTNNGPKKLPVRFLACLAVLLFTIFSGSSSARLASILSKVH
jgi:hypothetical protein